MLLEAKPTGSCGPRRRRSRCSTVRGAMERARRRSISCCSWPRTPCRWTAPSPPRESGRAARAPAIRRRAGFSVSTSRPWRCPKSNRPGPPTLRQVSRRSGGSCATIRALQRRGRVRLTRFVRLAATTPPNRPWVARHLYERALAGYRRAARLRPGAETDMGVARALAGLGRVDEAVALQRRAVAALPSQPLPQAQLMVYLEAAHRVRLGRRRGRAAASAGRRRAAGAGIVPRDTDRPALHARRRVRADLDRRRAVRAVHGDVEPTDSWPSPGRPRSGTCPSFRSTARALV